MFIKISKTFAIIIFKATDKNIFLKTFYSNNSYDFY